MSDPLLSKWSRRDVLRAGSTAAALAVTGALAAACGDDASTSGGKAKAVRDVPGRPPDAKTTERKHGPPQPSASRARDPLPPPLREYVARKHREGLLVKNDKSNVVHHPDVCKRHLGGALSKPRKHRKPRAPRTPKKAVTRRSAHPSAVAHARYADGILYALLRAETDATMRLGTALVCAMTWPVSVHFADLALAGMKKDGKPVVDEAAVAAALRAAQTQGGALPTPLGPSDAQVPAAVRLLRARLAERAAQKDRPRKPKKPPRAR